MLPVFSLRYTYTRNQLRQHVLYPQEPIVDCLVSPQPAPRVYPELSQLPRVFEPDLSSNPSCKCGIPWAQHALLTSFKQRASIVYSQSWFCEVEVKHRECEKCGRLTCNFSKYGILNLNDGDLFSHELLQW